MCRKLIDQDITLDEYEKTWEKHGDDGDICMACKTGKPRRKSVGSDEAGQDVRGVR